MSFAGSILNGGRILARVAGPALGTVGTHRLFGQPRLYSSSTKTPSLSPVSPAFNPNRVPFINLGLAQKIKSAGEAFRADTSKIDSGTIIRAEGKQPDILVLGEKDVADPEKKDDHRRSLLKLTGLPKETVFLSIVGDTPGTYSKEMTSNVKRVLDKIAAMKKLKDVAFLYGLTGSPVEGRAGINAIFTACLDASKSLQDRTIGLAVDFGTPFVIERFKSGSPKDIQFVVVTAGDGKAVNFGADSPINSVADVMCLFDGGAQSSLEAALTLSNGGCVVGVKNLRGEGNPSCTVDGVTYDFTSGGDMLDHITKFVMAKVINGEAPTRDEVDQTLKGYIYGANATTKWPDGPDGDDADCFGDVENQVKRIYNGKNYDAETKLPLFREFRRLLLQQDVINSLPDRCIIIDSVEIDAFPHILESIVCKKVPPRYFNLPPYAMPVVDIGKGRDLVISNEQFKEIARSGFFKVTLPKEFEADLNALKKFRETFLDGGRYGVEWNRTHPDVVGPLNGCMVGDSTPVKPFSAKDMKNQVIRFSLARSEGDDRWRFFPREVQGAAERLDKVGQQLIQRILEKIGIKPDDYDRATGGAASGKGDHFLCSNAYLTQVKNPETGMIEAVSMRGISEHFDWSVITLLTLEPFSPGLAVDVGGEYSRVWVTEENEIIVNSGSILEMLTKGAVKASNHFVFQTGGENIRTSTALFLDPGVMNQLYVVDPETGKLKPNPEYKSMLEYASDMSNRAYEREMERSDRLSDSPFLESEAQKFLDRDSKKI